MRFLHTSDWHIGKTLRGRSRLQEQESVLAEILEIADREAVDCLLVAGDVFDTRAPSAEAERVLFQFLAELIGKKIRAVLISGNHDHPGRLEALTRLVEPLGIFIRTRPGPDSSSFVQIPNGSCTARISLLPFFPHTLLTRASELFEGSGKDVRTYEEAVATLLGKSRLNLAPDGVNLLLGHFQMAEGRTSGSERRIHMSAPYEVSARHVPPGLHYVGLGHLHRPQQVRASSPTYYAGSPLQLDFGEQGQEKRVVLIEACPGRPAQCRSIPLTRGRPLFELEGALPELEDLQDSVGNAFLKVTVTAPRYEPGLVQKVRTIFPDAVEVRLGTVEPETVVRSQRIGRLSHRDMFREFYKSRGRPRPPARLLKAFDALYEEALVETD